MTSAVNVRLIMFQVYQCASGSLVTDLLLSVMEEVHEQDA